MSPYQLSLHALLMLMCVGQCEGKTGNSSRVLGFSRPAGVVGVEVRVYAEAYCPTCRDYMLNTLSDFVNAPGLSQVR
jgi:hypothetical protein